MGLLAGLLGVLLASAFVLTGDETDADTARQNDPQDDDDLRGQDDGSEVENLSARELADLIFADTDPDGVSEEAPPATDNDDVGTATDDDYPLLLEPGGSGDEALDLDASLDSLFGTSGDDVIAGTSGDDHMTGGDGEDQMNGYGGNDLMEGGNGVDRLHGAQGDDNVYGDAGDDEIDGESGDDRLSGGSGADILHGHFGADDLFGNSGDDLLSGGADADRLEGGAGSDALHGDRGDDRLEGNSGEDVLFGGWGDDHLTGAESCEDGTALDYLNGGSGDDILVAGSHDIATGSEGFDSFVVGHWIEGGSEVLVQDFDETEDALIIVFDDSAGSEPDVRIVPDDTHTDVSHVTMDGAPVAALQGVSGLSGAGFVLMAESEAVAAGLLRAC